MANRRDFLKSVGASAGSSFCRLQLSDALAESYQRAEARYASHDGREGRSRQSMCIVSSVPEVTDLVKGTSSGPAALGGFMTLI